MARFSRGDKSLASLAALNDPSAVVAGGKQRRKRKPIVHSRIVQIHVSDVIGDSLSLLSSKSPNGEIPLVLIPSPRCMMSMLMQVPSGVSCLVQKFGKDLGPFNPGAHFVPAFYRIAYVVSQQAVCYDAPVLECRTSDNVRVSVDVVLSFQIKDASAFVYGLGASNFDDFLKGTVDEAIRKLVRAHDHQNVYAMKGDETHSADMLKSLNDKFVKGGVQFNEVMIISVWVNEDLAADWEETTRISKKMELDEEAYRYNCMEIEMQKDMDIEQINRLQDQTLVQEAGRKRRAEIDFESRKVKVEEEGMVAMIGVERKNEVDNITVSNELDRTKKKLETIRVTEVASAEAKANEVKMKAEEVAEIDVIRAKWQEEKMISDAEVIKSNAGTETAAIEGLKAKRQHELNIKEKVILGSFAEKGKFNLIGSFGDQMVSALLNGTFNETKS
jgi:regulator of protease activity HflC (stomatin/prohibitin superfamily)